MPTGGRRSPSRHWVTLGALAVLLATSFGACGATTDPAGEAIGTSTTASEPRDEPAAESRAGSAVDALLADDMPTDEQSLNAALDALPSELLGRQRERSDGTVIYQSESEPAEGEPQVFIEVMEAADVGVRDETPRELLDMLGDGDGRTVTDRRTDPSAGVMYVRGSEKSGARTLHFLSWATEDGPYLFSAVASSSDDVDALVDAFAKATGTE